MVLGEEERVAVSLPLSSLLPFLRFLAELVWGEASMDLGGGERVALSSPL